MTWLFLFVFTLFSQITNPLPLSGTDLGYSAWSHDGTKMAYICHKAETLCVRDTSGGEEQIFNEVGSNIGGFSWSPDDTQVVYSTWSTSESETSDIYTIDLGTRLVTRITNNNTPDVYPAWSPDGTEIAYVAYGRESLYSYDSDIYIFNLNTNEDRQLTHDGAYFHFEDSNPVWSPDGKYIAYISDRDSITEWEEVVSRNLYVVEVDGEEQPLRLSSSVGTESFPAWSPNGKYIAFGSNSNEQGQNVKVLTVGTGEIVAVTNHKEHGFSSGQGWHDNMLVFYDSTYNGYVGTVFN